MNGIPTDSSLTSSHGERTQTFFALLSSTARSAIATIRVCGPAADSAITNHFSSISGRAPGGLKQSHIAFGHWTRQADSISNETGEGIVICRIDEQTFDIHCHGGIAAQSAIAEDLNSSGLRQLGQEQVHFLLHEDAIKAEAADALLQATTDRTAAILLDQFNGCLRDEITACRHLIMQNDILAAHERVQSMLDASKTGKHLVEPFRVVIAGRPNVGKSSLLNALLGHRRAIVFDQPGTTRDIVSSITAFDGWPAELSDTAGLRPTDDLIESTGVEKASRLISDANLVVLVFDSTSEWTEEDDQLFQSIPSALVVFSKSDLESPESHGEVSTSNPCEEVLATAIRTSIRETKGIEELSETIGKRLIEQVLAQRTAVPFTERQIVLLERIRDTINPKCTEKRTAQALELLDQLLGGYRSGSICQAN